MQDVTYINLAELFTDAAGNLQREYAEAWLGHTPAALLEYVLPTFIEPPLRRLLAEIAAAARDGNRDRLTIAVLNLRRHFESTNDGDMATGLLTTFVDLWARGSDYKIWEEFKRYVV